MITFIDLLKHFIGPNKDHFEGYNRIVFKTIVIPNTIQVYNRRKTRLFGTLTPQKQHIKPLSWFTGFNASPENHIQDPNGRPQWPPCLSASPPPLKQHIKPLCGHSNLLCEFTEHITLPQNRFQHPKRKQLCRGMLRNVPPALNNTHNQYLALLSFTPPRQVLFLFAIFQEYSMEYSIFQNFGYFYCLAIFLEYSWNIPYSIIFKIFTVYVFFRNIPYSNKLKSILLMIFFGIFHIP